MQIPLGFELASGKPVSVPLGHMAVTGQTQQSGKTTALEAMITRSGLRGIAFVTKRGEKTFSTGRAVRPYFQESADWQFVEAMLEATLRTSLKFQQSWIMKLCDASHKKDQQWEKPRTLKDVAANIEIALRKARGLNESVYIQLREYLRLVIPQIERLPRTDTLDLKPGLNVMWLDAFTVEMQALVIRSVIEWIAARESKTITIIPEAWKMIPQGRQSPVLLACEDLIRQGATNENFIWLDSQDIAGVHKSILRQVMVWIIGVQREVHETERALDHLPRALSKIGRDDVTQLRIGQFYVSWQDRLIKTYVQPVWMTAAMAQLVAMGQAEIPKRPDDFKRVEDEMWRERAEAAEKAVADLKAEVERLKDELKALRSAAPTKAPELNSFERTAHEAMFNSSPTTATELAVSVKMEGSVSGQDTNPNTLTLVKNGDGYKLIGTPFAMHLLTAQREIQISVKTEIVELTDATLQGKIAKLIAEGFFDQKTSASAAWSELQRRGTRTAKPNAYKECDALSGLGFLFKEQGGYVRVPGMKITKHTIESEG